MFAKMYACMFLLNGLGSCFGFFLMIGSCIFSLRNVFAGYSVTDFSELSNYRL